MDTKKTPETPEEREKLLSALKPRDRDLIERILDQHPELTVAEAIEHADEAGGLSLSGTELAADLIRHNRETHMANGQTPEKPEPEKEAEKRGKEEHEAQNKHRQAQRRPRPVTPS
jgi:hypothetical protein